MNRQVLSSGPVSAPRDVCIVGAGIVGLATAHALQTRRPGITITVLEKESSVGTHQTGHNSGVLHSGLYYTPGSVKAGMCLSGRKQMEAFCDESGIAYRRSGRIVVATDEAEQGALAELHRRGTANGLEGLEWLGPDRIKELEPSVAGTRALLVPETGVVDFAAIARALAVRIEDAGAEIRMNASVVGIRTTTSETIVDSTNGDVAVKAIVNCAGLHSDSVARLGGAQPGVSIVPFRGEYYELSDDAPRVNALICPVPDPRLPFLGVHFTRRIDNRVEAGPNAVLAFGQEHYKGTRADLRQLGSTLADRSFRRLARRYWRTGLSEIAGSLSKRIYAARARRLVPDLEAAHLRPAGSGVRAQAVTPAGGLADDFLIDTTPQMINVLNAPSPGATASLAFGDHIAGKVEDLLGVV